MNNNIVPSKFPVLSKEKYRDSRKLKPNDIISLPPKRNDQERSETNIPGSQTPVVATSVDANKPGKVAESPKSILLVANDGLKSPIKKNFETATVLNGSKEDWSLGEILNLNIKEIPFLVERLIPQETLVVLAGQSEIGKSTLYTQLGLAIIRGDKEFLGCKINSKFNRVLIESSEDGPIAMSFRTNRQCEKLPVEKELWGNMKVMFNFHNLEARIEKHLAKNPVDLVIIDAFCDVLDGYINDSNSVRKYFNKYVTLIQKYHCSVLFVHHVCKGAKKQKAEKDQLLGSTGIEGKMRNVLMLTIVNDQHQLSIVKGNYVSRKEKKNPLYLDFDEKTLTFSRAEGPTGVQESDDCIGPIPRGSIVKKKPGKQRDEALYNKAIMFFEEGLPQTQIARIVNRNKSTICHWIREYKSKHNDPVDVLGV